MQSLMRQRFLLFVFFHEIGPPLNGIVNGKVREVETKGLTAILIDELKCFIGEPVGQVIALLVTESIEFEGCMITFLRPALVPIFRHMDIESLLQRPRRCFAQMPFAKMSRPVAMLLQYLSQR